MANERVYSQMSPQQRNVELAQLWEAMPDTTSKTGQLIDDRTTQRLVERGIDLSNPFDIMDRGRYILSDQRDDYLDLSAQAYGRYNTDYFILWRLKFDELLKTAPITNSFREYITYKFSHEFLEGVPKDDPEQQKALEGNFIHSLRWVFEQGGEAGVFEQDAEKRKFLEQKGYSDLDTVYQLFKSIRERRDRWLQSPAAQNEPEEILQRREKMKQWWRERVKKIDDAIPRGLPKIRFDSYIVDVAFQERLLGEWKREFVEMYGEDPK